MTFADIANGCFELGGGIANLLNCLALYRTKEVKGVSIPATVFFTSWGWWNAIWYYPSLDQWASFSGGLVIVTANTLWIAMALYYTRKNHDRATT